MSRRRISLGIAANVYDKAIIAAVQLVMVGLLAKAWGLETYGAWLLLATLPTFLGMSDLGFATAAGTRMTMAVASGDREGAAVVLSSAWSFVLLGSVLAGLISLLVIWGVPLASFPETTLITAQEAQRTLTWLAFYGLVCLQGGFINAAFRCSGHYALGTILNANTVLLENIAAGLIVLAGYGPVEVAVTLLATRCMALSLQFLVLRRTVQWLKPTASKASWASAKALLHPALAIMALPIGQAAFLQGTVIALGAVAGAAAVPAFAAARTLSRIGLQATQLVVHALMPEFTAAVAREDRRTQARMLVVTLGSAAVVLVPFAMILALAGSWLIELWTSGVVQAPRSLMIVMALTVVLGGLWNPLSNLILAMNRHASFSYIFAVLAVLTVPATYVLGKHWGPTGAGVALLALDGLMFLLILHLSRRMFVTSNEVILAVRELHEELVKIVAIRTLRG